MGYERKRVTLDGRNLGVVLIDMDNHYTGNLKTSVMEDVVRQQRKVIRRCAEDDIFLVVNEGDATISDLAKEIEKVPRVFYPSTSDVPVFSELKKQNINTLLLMGVYASWCVRAFAENSLAAGFKIATARRLIADHKYRRDDLPKRGREWYSKHGTFYRQVPKISSPEQS